MGTGCPDQAKVYFAGSKEARVGAFFKGARDDPAAVMVSVIHGLPCCFTAHAASWWYRLTHALSITQGYSAVRFAPPFASP